MSHHKDRREPARQLEESKQPKSPQPGQQAPDPSSPKQSDVAPSRK
jgi:hypothetical protein